MNILYWEVNKTIELSSTDQRPKPRYMPRLGFNLPLESQAQSYQYLLLLHYPFQDPIP